MIDVRYLGPCFQFGAKVWINGYGAGIVILFGPFLFEIALPWGLGREDRFAATPKPKDGSNE